MSRSGAAMQLGRECACSRLEMAVLLTNFSTMYRFVKAWRAKPVDDFTISAVVSDSIAKLLA